MKTSRHSTRRRFLQITGLAGFAAAVPHLFTKGDGNKTSEARPWEWNGILLGSDVSISLHGIENENDAKHLTDICRDEMLRLEAIFSLHQSASTICSLNRNGAVASCPPEFLELINESKRISAISGGAFDVTIQSLWQVLDEHDFSHTEPDTSTIERALAKVDWRKLITKNGGVQFAEADMAITLNGIAQGYITDRITHLLKEHGVEHALVNMGEFRALGTHPDNRPWLLGVRAPNDTDDTLVDAVEIGSNQALAVSGGHSYAFNAEATRHHLLHPHTGANMPADRTVAVIAPNATLADALSTACAVVNDSTAVRICDAAQCKLEIYRNS